MLWAAPCFGLAQRHLACGGMQGDFKRGSGQGGTGARPGGTGEQEEDLLHILQHSATYSLVCAQERLACDAEGCSQGVQTTFEWCRAQAARVQSPAAPAGRRAGPTAQHAQEASRPPGQVVMRFSLGGRREVRSCPRPGERERQGNAPPWPLSTPRRRSNKEGSEEHKHPPCPRGHQNLPRMNRLPGRPSPPSQRCTATWQTGPGVRRGRQRRAEGAKARGEEPLEPEGFARRPQALAMESTTETGAGRPQRAVLTPGAGRQRHAVQKGGKDRDERVHGRGSGGRFLAPT